MEHNKSQSEGLKAVTSLLNSRRVTVSQLAAGGSSSEQDIQNKLIEISIDREQQRQITKLIKQKLDKILNDTPQMRDIWREKLAKEASTIEKTLKNEKTLVKNEKKLNNETQSRVYKDKSIVWNTTRVNR